MNAVAKARIIKIGNSRGIRIPKLWLEQLGLAEEVELSVRQDHLVVRPSRRPRQDWDERFRAMADQGDDRLLDAGTGTKWDETEWRW